MDYDLFIMFLQQSIVSGVVTGSVYALLGLAVVMVFKVTEVTNFALGEVFMVGAVVAFILVAQMGLPYVAAIPLALLASYVTGQVMSQFVLEPVIKRGGSHVSLVFLTIGFSFVLKGLVRISERVNEPKSFPPLFSNDPIIWGNVVLSVQDLMICLCALAALAIFFWYFNFTKGGQAIRAVGSNPRAAAIVGINLSRMRNRIWALSAVVTGVAAILVSPKLLVTPDMGWIVILAFAAAIIGGLSSLTGAVIGGFVVGITENMVGLFISSNAISVAPFVAIMIVLLLRPQGLFGSKPVMKKL